MSILLVIQRCVVWRMWRVTAAYYFRRLREIIARQIEQELHKVFGDAIGVSYFGGYRKGNHGIGAGGKMAVFGLLKRGGKVYTKIIQDTPGATLMPTT